MQNNYILIFVISYVFLLLIPIRRIYTRAGINPIWSLTIFFPYLGLFLCLAILAASDWNFHIYKENNNAK